jgi:hypothetical protein
LLPAAPGGLRLLEPLVGQILERQEIQIVLAVARLE